MNDVGREGQREVNDVGREGQRVQPANKVNGGLRMRRMGEALRRRSQVRKRDDHSSHPSHRAVQEIPSIPPCIAGDFISGRPERLPQKQCDCSCWVCAPHSEQVRELCSEQVR